MQNYHEQGEYLLLQGFIRSNKRTDREVFSSNITNHGYISLRYIHHYTGVNDLTRGAWGFRLKQKISDQSISQTK